MKNHFLSAGTVALLLLTFAACKKESAGSSRSQIILGTWVVSATGIDVNRNKTLESSEYDTVTANFFSSITFLAGGEAVNNYQRTANAPFQTDSTLQWKLRDGDRFLDLMTPGFGALSSEIIVLNETELALYFDDPVFPQISVNHRQ